MLHKFEFLRAYFSPFKPLKLKWYIGKIAVGTPYFYPRRWVENPRKPGYMKAIPRKFGLDIVGLGWKTKFDSFRFEYSPVVSFVFFGWQIAVTFTAPEMDHYWECWLNYRTTNRSKSTADRLLEAREKYSCIWVGGDNKQTCYWDLILKDKWIKKKN